MQFSKPLQTSSPYQEIDFPHFKLQGISIAGIETALVLPQLNICLDSGRCPEFAFAMDTLALTHWHLDHAGGLPIYLGLRRLNKLKPAQIIVPQTKLAATQKFLEVLQETSDTQIAYQVISVAERFDYTKRYTIREIENFHCAPSTGYLIEEKRRHLKDEFRDKTQSDIITLKKSGVVIEETSYHPLVAFSGDSLGKFLGTAANQAEYLICECSFFSDEIEDFKIEKYMHAHIRDWQKYAEQIQSKHVIMTHTSQRHSREFIWDQCKKYLPEALLEKLIILR